MKNELAQLVEVIKKKKVLAESKIDPEHVATYRTKMGHIKRAKEDLEELYLQYRDALKQRAVFILVSGTQVEKFTKLASEEFDCFTVDADQFYKDMANTINPRLYTNCVASPALFDLLNSHFEARAKDIGIIGFPALIFESKYKKMLKNNDDMVALTKRAFNDRVGGEVVGLDAVDVVARKAVNNNVSSAIVPIVLHSSDQELIAQLNKSFKQSPALPNNVFVISAGSVKNEELKNKSLSKLKSATTKTVQASLEDVKNAVKTNMK